MHIKNRLVALKAELIEQGSGHPEQSLYGGLMITPHRDDTGGLVE